MTSWICWFAVVVLGSESAVGDALSRVSLDRMRADVEYLASDALQGRFAGEEGCEKAAQYIASEFEKAGLTPLGDDGTFLDGFRFRSTFGLSDSHNVLALWKGSDPQLSKQYVVIGGHYDHLGTGDSHDTGKLGTRIRDDEIWNGADDNASGTSVVLELARCLSDAKYRPARSIVFALFSAEEHGLLGSIDYCENPAVPLGSTVAMVNLDMVGRNPGKPLEMLGMSSLANNLWYLAKDRALQSVPGLTIDEKSFAMADSDHHSFLNRRVPAVFLFAGLHEDYHRVTDHADKVSWKRMDAVSRFSLALLVDVANTRERLEFREPVFETRRRKALGIAGDGAVDRATMDALGYGADQGGFRVNSVAGGSAGEKAGLQVGDVILSFRGRTLSPDDPAASLRRAVASSPNGEDLGLIVVREGKEVTLTVRW